jgi:choline dehydrogenase-like flavoprotein
MIIDLITDDIGPELFTEVCVVGSGAAGLAIARELAASNIDVTVLESGGEKIEPGTQELYSAEFIGFPFHGAHEGRFRVLGGSTTKWGGQALPLRRLDFESRSWVNESGWPINYDEMAPFYQRANAFLGIDNHDYRDELLSILCTVPPSFDLRDIEYHFSKWCPTPNLRDRYRQLLFGSRTIRVVLHANVTAIQLDEEGAAVDRIVARTIGGRELAIRARYYALCCGGIENARLLLTNRDRQPSGIGNTRDLVGRYLQDHPAARIGQILSREPDKIQRLFNLFHRGGRKYSVRLSATDDLQRRTQTLSVSAALMFETASDSSFARLKDAYHRLRRRSFDAALVRTLSYCALHARELASPLYHYYVKRRTFTPNPLVALVINAEQEPRAESRVSLSADRDALGVPRARIDWRVSDLTYRTVQAFALRLENEFQRLALGKVVLEPWVMNNDSEWHARISDQNHHIGTTRMHESKQQGVVDATCRVHEMKNLYIAGSSVFPTGGHSNPTLTLIALSIRLADHLKTELCRPASGLTKCDAEVNAPGSTDLRSKPTAATSELASDASVV